MWAESEGRPIPDWAQNKYNPNSPELVPSVIPLVQ